LLKNLIKIVIQRTAEVTAGQEQALSMTTNLAKSEMEELSILAGETGATIVELRESIVSDISPTLIDINFDFFSDCSSQRLFLSARSKFLWIR